MDDKFYRILKHKSNEFELDSAGGRMTVRARGRLKRARRTAGRRFCAR